MKVTNKHINLSLSERTDNEEPKSLKYAFTNKIPIKNYKEKMIKMLEDTFRYKRGSKLEIN
jgi:hypothetical protein